MLLNLQEKYTLAKPPNQTKTTHQQKTQSKTQQKNPTYQKLSENVLNLLCTSPSFPVD